MESIFRGNVSQIQARLVPVKDWMTLPQLQVSPLAALIWKKKLAKVKQILKWSLKMILMLRKIAS